MAASAGWRSFRFRLIVTVVALVAVAVSTLAVGAYVFVERSLRDQREDRAVADTSFLVGTLAGVRLQEDADLTRFESSPFVTDLNRAVAGYHVRFADGTESVSGFAFAADPSEALMELVDDGQVGFEWVERDGHRYVVVGARLPPAGPAFYLYHDGQAVDEALSTLRRALGVGGAALVLVAAGTGGLVARGVLRPVRAASVASRRIADGELDFRLSVPSGDEFGQWAETFNQMAAALQAKVTALEAAEADQRRFVADVSHELRTPLTGLVNEALLLQEHLDHLPPDGARAAELLVLDVARLRRLVEDLLEISRLEASPSDRPASDATGDDFADFAADGLVDVGASVTAIAAARLPEATVSTAELGLLVRADTQRLERIVGNLLDNASYHGAGSPVELLISRRGDKAAVVVADRGPGVAGVELERIFGRFAKADSSRRRGGSGLGLAIARAHATSLGGELTAHQREGGGLAFVLLLPLAGVTEPLPERAPLVATDGQG